MKVKKLTCLAILTAVALIMFVLEAQIVFPIPVVKLGLSNIISTGVLFMFGWREALAVLLLRVLLGSIITAQLGSIAYSLAGGLLSLVGMILLRRILTGKQLWVAGILGGILHNLGQLIAAIVISNTVSLIVYLPLLLCCGLLAGLFTGLCAQFLLQRLSKLNYLEDIK